jgi:hypothetical protein
MALLKQYLWLCWFKNNPKDLHPSIAFLWKNVMFYLVSGAIVEGLISDPADGFLEVLMRIVVAVSLLFSLVLILKRRHLLVQLITAVFVCENFIVTLGILTEILDVFIRNTEYRDLSMGLGVILVLWYVAIISYILRGMFDFRTAPSIGLAISYFLLTYGGPFLAMEVL